MKDFCNILEAASYHKECCRCKGPMRPYFRDEQIQVTESYYNSQSIEINLSAQMDSDTDDILKVNLVTNRVSLELRPRFKERFLGYIDDPVLGSTTKHRFRTSGNYQGTLYEGLEVTCSRCHNFSYTIQLVIDIEQERRIKHLFLNSEYIIWSDKDGNTHEIRNVYTIGKTECALFKGYDKCQRISIPIIPLDLSNPEETMQRIKVLNTFS